MNEQLTERSSRSRKGRKEENGRVEIWAQPQQLNPRVREYFEQQQVNGGSWLDYPKIPAEREVLDINTDGSSTSDVVEIQPNRPRGAWESKEEYLSGQYELLREDALRPLRDAVSRVKATPSASEGAFNGEVGIYDKVHICEIICSSRGMATGVTFSLERAGKKILWEQSKRLISGSLVVLTPASDKFQTKAIVATVAARPLDKLERNPPEIALLMRADEQEIDPAEEFLMVEDRGGLYEASRHTLLALQRMMKEPFPLSDHLVNVKSKVMPPEYIEKQPRLDLTSVLNNDKHETYEKVEVLNSWPSQPKSELDASQLAALRRILTKRLAIVQGPPGTGKTFVSTQAIKVLLTNRKDDDPPIIVACQTNHAVDQILRHIAAFEKEFIRLGGRSKDQEVIKARTLYEVRNAEATKPIPGSLAPGARKKMRDIEKEIAILLTPLQFTKQPLEFHALENLHLLSKQQADSLEAGAAEWVQGQLSDPKQAQSPFTVWLGTSLTSVPPRQAPEDFGFEAEEADLEFEQLKELEAENVAKDDDHFENLSGTVFQVADNFTCRKKSGTSAIPDTKLEDIMKEQNMWKIPEAERPAVYRYLQRELKKVILGSIREKAKVFNEEAARLRIGHWEKDETILKTQKIIGMTTTGLSKYRGLIAALQPKIVLIEEAAETLEAPVTVACLPSLQHLILVGDHQQLRPHCHVKAHEDQPYFLNVSLFERLVNNKVEFTTLNKQRRMTPEIRRLLYPIYGSAIEDHQVVLDPAKRPNVPGMGGVNSWFFSHENLEQRDDQMSAYNPFEANLIVKFVEYLVLNGMETDEITVLTFYNGQRKRILKLLRASLLLQGRKFTVVTVDSYQGEENKVVLLSLVRNNGRGQIGFLDIVNRVCVALSRAQCGFYLFGNGTLLFGHKIWRRVLKIMLNNGQNARDHLQTNPKSRVGEKIFVTCSNHGNRTAIVEGDDFEKINGGCALKCEGDLACGHPCPLLCHPFPHDNVICRKQCIRELSCGHICSAQCGQPCTCNICNKQLAPENGTNGHSGNDTEPFDGKETLSKASSTDSWNSFAKAEPIRYSTVTSPRSQSTSPLKKEKAKPLLDVQAEETTTNVQEVSLGLDGHVSQTQLVEEKFVANGTRVKRKEKFTSGSTETAPIHKKDWSREGSLLD